MEEIIKLFLKGECSQEQLEQLYDWLSKPEHSEQVEALFEKAWEQSDANTPLAEFDKLKVLKGIMQKTQQGKVPQQMPIKKGRISDREPYRQRRSKIPMVLKTGLGLVVLLAILFQVFINPSVAEQDAISTIKREAPRGYRNTINLSDGSKVILNSESSIEYLTDFGVSNRKIQLTGEAFFEVAHDAELPFVVTANGVKTTALGTSFNINASSPYRQTVSLATGKVRVESVSNEADPQSKNELLLSPGEEALWKHSEASFTKRPFDPNLVFSWKDNVIYFKNTKLRRMIRVLEKWYDVQITIDGNLDKLTQTGTGTFANESLETVLNSLSFSMGFEYAIDNGNITIQLTEE